ncbi:GNAT family N-acetyltransferase [Bowmanella dokdonensis]|uniref:GNAT family N-acetyltransferase n=1 Tax=Bowmanella dokdonensis TaxID=751969 RepID=A0A939INF1_9ALTE|nr:GNAT family N-acetyltransferase [Bowmanella dokdonensis]MBN7826288.1 GNAT family N-acetyltransferase [Bowmanella dokdonensis]
MADISAVPGCQFIQAAKHHMLTVMDWFPDQNGLTNWGGPAMRFPVSPQSFLQDSRWQELASYVLLKEEQLLGFGQYYLRAGRCHLGRLAIAPDWRGRRLVETLIYALVETGCAQLAVDEVSLFVLAQNKPALRCYQRLGFRIVAYPGQLQGIEGCLYMVAGKSHILS